MADQDFIVLFPQEYLNTDKDSTVFGDLEPFPKGGSKISITQKSEDGDGSLVFFPEHWGTCFGINEDIFEEKDKTKEENEKKNSDEPPKFSITYVLDSRQTYDEKNEKMTEGAQNVVDSFVEFRKRLLAHLKSEDVIDELPEDIQMKLKNPATEDSAIRPIVVYPNKTETITVKGKTKEKKIPDKSKPPRIYGNRVLRNKKGNWVSTFQRASPNPNRKDASPKDADALMEEMDPNSLMNVPCEIRPLIKLDYLFVKENKLCLQLRVLEGIVIPFAFRKLGGLANKKMGWSNKSDECDPNSGLPETQDGDTQESNNSFSSSKEDEEKKAKRRAARAARTKNQTNEDDE